MAIRPDQVGCFDHVIIQCREYLRNHAKKKITRHDLTGHHEQYCLYECDLCGATRLALPSEGINISE